MKESFYLDYPFTYSENTFKPLEIKMTKAIFKNGSSKK